MTEIRGRPFGFLGTLCTVWIASRIGFLSVLTPGNHVIPPVRSDPVRAITVAEGSATAATKPGEFACCTDRARGDRSRIAKLGPQAALPPLLHAAPTSSPAAPPMPPAPRLLAPLAVWPVPASPDGSAGSSLYRYSFFRSGGQPGGFGSHYGGSQSGFVATYAPGGDDRLALLVRGAIAHDRPAERELAAGLRWRPVRRLPVSITAERRFRHARSDALAFYLAGGVSKVALPLRFDAEGFAQAGFVTGKDAGPFFDFAARAERRLAAIGDTTVAIGAGVWGGGQNRVMRIDAGPTIGTEIALDDTRLRLSADWRFRIAGDARPASGPALTLSTSF